MADGMALAQVAFSVLDLDKTYDWYTDVFGFRRSGGSTDLVGPEAAACQGLPASNSEVRWMVDQQDLFQLEFFLFTEPTPKPRRADWRPDDIGYSMVGIHVADFDAVITRPDVDPFGPVVGESGARRVCLRDPEGVLLEVMEDDPRHADAGPRVRPDIPAAVRFVRLVVADLALARTFFVDTLGMEPAPDDIVHTREHESLWGLSGAAPEVLAVWSGDAVIEIVSYPQRASRPRPDNYLISDQGIVNIAIASH